MTEPVRVSGWHPRHGPVQIDIPPGHPAYELLRAESVRALALGDPTAARIIPTTEEPAMDEPTVTVNLTVTVPQTDAPGIAELLSGTLARATAAYSVASAAIDLAHDNDEPVSTAYRVAPGTRLFLVGPDREYEVRSLATGPDGAELRLVPAAG